MYILTFRANIGNSNGKNSKINIFFILNYNNGKGQIQICLQP